MLMQAAVVVFIVAYLLIASERLNRVGVALGGAAVMVLIGATDAERVYYDHNRGIDWNVMFLLLGMMIIVGFIHRTGVFEFLAVHAIRKVGGNPRAALAVLMTLTAIASAILDNVTTILLVVPMTLIVTHHLRVSPVPFLLAEVFASNIGGAATLVGDPPNIIIASRAGIGFNAFLGNLAPVAVAVMLVTVPLLQVLFRKQLVNTASDRASISHLEPRDYLKDPVLMSKSLTVLTIVVIGFITHSFTHIEPSLIALLGAGVLAVIGGVAPADFLKDVEWETLLFFAGLFIMVGALVNVGALTELANLLKSFFGDDLRLATSGLLFVSALLSGVIDNIPYVVSLSPVVADLSTSFGNSSDNVLWWALALGADFGGNLTIIGASANVVAMGLAHRAGYSIGFWQFLKYGLPVTALSIAVSYVYLLLRYF